MTWIFTIYRLEFLEKWQAIDIKGYGENLEGMKIAQTLRNPERIECHGQRRAWAKLLWGQGFENVSL